MISSARRNVFGGEIGVQQGREISSGSGVDSPKLANLLKTDSKNRWKPAIFENFHELWEFFLFKS